MGYEPKKGDIVRVGKSETLWEVYFVGRFHGSSRSVSLMRHNPPETGNFRGQNTTVDSSRLVLVKDAPPPPPPRYFSYGALAIMGERVRQVEEEKYTPEHDAEQEAENGISGLTIAALCYMTAALQRANGSEVNAPVWPWDGEMKSTDIDRDLTKAGALIAAELDRRAAAK